MSNEIMDGINKVKGVIMNKAKRDALNNFISVEIAQAVSRIICKVQELDEDLLKARTPKRKDVKSSNLQDVYSVKGAVFDLYWSAESVEDIAHHLGLRERYVTEFLVNELPIDLVNELYMQGQYPSRIARHAAVKTKFNESVGVKPTTNHIRRILQLPLV